MEHDKGLPIFPVPNDSPTWRSRFTYAVDGAMRFFSRLIVALIDEFNEHVADKDDPHETTEYIEANGFESLNVGVDPNYMEITNTGHVILHGSATTFDDLRVSPLTAKLRGTSDPSFEQFKDNGATSVGVFCFHFSKTIVEEIFFTVQLPHGYKEGSDIYPHVHWSPIDTDTGSVVWRLEYVWQNFGGTFGDTSNISVVDPAEGVAYKHQIAGLPVIDGTGGTISSVLVCRLYRNGAAVKDTYDNKAALLEFDFHYEADTDGSNQEYVK